MNNLRNSSIYILLAACAAFSPAASAQTLEVTQSAPTVSETFDSMYDGSAGTLALPTGWRIERNQDGARRIGTWDAAATVVQYAFDYAGTVQAGNAKNGTWNWGSTSDASDRAVGGLSTGVANGNRCTNVMVCITNADTEKINKLAVSYDIEQYRYGSNAAGWEVSMLVSTDGTTWTSAGNDFLTTFEPDSQTLGAATLPIKVTHVVDKTVLTDIAAGQSIYLAWQITVRHDGGSDCASAPGYAVDNIEVTAHYALSGEDACNIYIEDVTGWADLKVFAADGTMGTYPGAANYGTRNVNGVAYKAFEVTSLPAEITVNNGVYYNLPGTITLTEPGDYFYTATTQGLTVVADPNTYTGYTDPTIPAFTASGIYLRGGMNSWAADAEWEFSDEGNGSYALYNKVLSGEFKVGDASWSPVNYGSNGGNLMPGEPYALVASSTSSNISTGSNTYQAKEIRLDIDAEGNATLTILTDDDATGLVTVYAVGDFNNWDYMDTTGALNYDTADGLFHGEISMPKAADGLSHWRIYQKTGMGGAWGLEANAADAATEGTFTKGKTGNATVAPGRYAIAFNLATGAYTMERQPSEIVDMAITPAQTLLVPGVPEEVKVFSMNNSLIEYCDQPTMFNEMTAAMGKNATWTRHTNLGKTLDYHWDEGEGLTSAGTPSAKMMIRSQAWTHIILQEQTARPVNNTEAFFASVRKWVEYIRTNCPNPNAVIILPMNWEYSSNLGEYIESNNRFAEIYRQISEELGIVVCPVALGYSEAYTDLGGLAMKDAMYLPGDDRHPTPAASYMAACMEYSLIFGEDASTITWAPTTAFSGDPANNVHVDVAKADTDRTRGYAAAAMGKYTNLVSHTDGTVTFRVEMIDDNDLTSDPESVEYSVSGGGSISPEGVFTAEGTEGTYTVTATSGSLTRTATVTVASPVTEVVTFPAIELDNNTLELTETFDGMTSLTLPEAWRVERNMSRPREVNAYSQASTDVMYTGSGNLASNASNGTYRFESTSESGDYAIGGLTTGSVGGNNAGTRGVNVMTHLVNKAKKDLVNPTITYDVEKYRNGNNAAGFQVQLYYSLNGNTWTSLGDDFLTVFPADSNTGGLAEEPSATVHVEGTLPFDLQRGVDYYFAWNISVASGTTCSGAQGLAIDNVNISAEMPPVPTALHYIYAQDQTGWSSLGLYAYSATETPSEILGAWPGQAPVDEREINGVTYKVFLLDLETEGTYRLIFNNWNNGKQTADYEITPNRDHYLRVTDPQVFDNEVATGLQTVSLDSVKIVYMRPNVKAEGADAIEVYTATGMQALSTRTDAADLSVLPKGMYLVRAIKDGKSSMLKIML